MKIYHFVLLFVIISIASIVMININTNDLKAVINNEEKIDKNLKSALDDGVNCLVEVDLSNQIVINKDAAISSFFMSLASSFGIISDIDNREKLNMYIPVITVTMDDGYYVFYCDEYKSSDESRTLSKRWSERFPYYYEDDDFVYGFTLGDIVTMYDKNGLLNSVNEQTVVQLDYHDFQNKEEYTYFRQIRPESFLLSDESFEAIRKGVIINCLENSMAYYTSRHNNIAAHYGITYNFAFPAVSEEEWELYLDDISMFVVFQGYPYGGEDGELYNRFASSGAKVSKKEVYYLEQKEWYLVYHRATCPELQKDGVIFNDEPFYSIESCSASGAYACKECGNGKGVYAPTLSMSLDE